jgi:hypothetical protein
MGDEMTIRTAEAKWNRDLTQASAQMRLWREECESPYDFSRAWTDLAAVAFEEYAQDAKNNCLVSRALSGVDIHLHSELL